MLDSEQLAARADRIRASGLLGRSGQLSRLFDYLVECSVQGKSPKEIDIAVEALGRGAEFDVTQDAVVRVYVHKLRRRLAEFYGGPGSENQSAPSSLAGSIGFPWSRTRPPSRSR